MPHVPSASGPRVSVCVPVYNGEAFLSLALDSILAQTFDDYELIIADNASTDDTPKICRRYAERDPRIRYIRNETNIGANPNFNRLVGLARTPYFKLANADDLSHPDLLARCVSVLDRHPEVVLCYGRTTIIDSQGNRAKDYDDDLDLRWPSAPARFRAAVQRTTLVNVLQGVIRTDVLRQTSLLGSYPGADVLLLAALALRGQFYEVPERLFLRRIHPGASGSLGQAERQAFIDPIVRTSHSLPILRRYLGYLSAFVHTPLPPRDRALLFAWVIRSVLWNRQIRAELLYFVRFSLRRLRTGQRFA